MHGVVGCAGIASEGSNGIEGKVLDKRKDESCRPSHIHTFNNQIPRVYVKINLSQMSFSRYIFKENISNLGQN